MAQDTVIAPAPASRTPRLMRWWRREGLTTEAHAYFGTSWMASVCGNARWTAALELASRGPVCAGCAVIARAALDQAEVELAELDARDRLGGIEQYQSEGR